MEQRDIEKQKKKIFRETKKNMDSLGTYRQEFDVIIYRYAEMRMQFDMLNKRWYDEGCRVTVEYTNKAGATNETKTVLYLAIEKLRDELNSIESILGLTPKGLQSMKKSGLDKPKKSALDKLLDG